MKKDSFVVVDLETTGLEPKKDRILEIGAIRVEDGEITEEFSTFINPRMEIPRYVQELTGITQNMVSHAPAPREGVDAFLDFCKDDWIMGHNVIFDYSFLKHEAVNMDKSFEKKAVDTLKIARKVLPQLESRRLTALCEYYQIPHEHAHRAFEDAKVTFELYKKLREEFMEKEPGLFVPKPLIYQVKKQTPITKKQKAYLIDLLKYHRIESNVEIDSLTRSEASRMVDKIISEHGRIQKNQAGAKVHRNGGKNV